MLPSSESLMDSVTSRKPTDSYTKSRRKRKYSFQEESQGKRRRFHWSYAAHEEFTANVFEIGLMNATPQKVLGVFEKLSDSKLTEGQILKHLLEYAQFRLHYRYGLLGQESVYDKNAKKRQSTQFEIVERIQKLINSNFIEEETVQSSKNDLQFLVWKRQISKTADRHDDSESCGDNESSDVTSFSSEQRTSKSPFAATAQPPQVAESATSDFIPAPRRVHFYRPVDDVMSYQGRVIQFSLKIPFVDAQGRGSVREVSIRNYYHASLASLVIAASSPETPYSLSA